MAKSFLLPRGEEDGQSGDTSGPLQLQSRIAQKSGHRKYLNIVGRHVAAAADFDRLDVTDCQAWLYFVDWQLSRD
jgi:hypothetical protein